VAHSEVRSRLDAGWECVRDGEWERALEHFEFVAEREPGPEADAAVAHAARWAGRAELALSVRERAYREFRRAGEDVAAARMATWLAYDHRTLRGDVAVAQGWTARAERLLEGVEEGPAHGWLLYREAEQLIARAKEFDRALALSERAREIGRRSGDLDLELVALSLCGLAQVAAGEVEVGMRRLDEAAAAAVAGEIAEPSIAGTACCHLIAACEQARDLERAAEWCRAAERVADERGLRQLFAVCRSHYAGYLMWRGDFDAAEAELERAEADFAAASASGLAHERLVQLADLRRRQGRADDAERLCASAAWHPLAIAIRAELALERGDASEACALAERHLRRLPAGSRLAALRGLDLLTRARLAADDPDGASATAAELRELAALAPTAVTRAMVFRADGLVAAAREDLRAARGSLEDALDLLDRCGARHDAALTRLELTGVLARAGDVATARVEARAAGAVLAELGASGGEARAEALSRELGAGPVDAPQGPLSARELQVLRLVADGLSNPEIAERLVVSPHTVHRHMANIRTKMHADSKAAAIAEAARLGLL
jgi:LuxR family transcriptional regulator, maltose regulon positive regulatory protein